MTTPKKHAPAFITEMKQQLEAEQTTITQELATLTGGAKDVHFPDYGRNDEDNATEIADHTAAASTEDVLEQRLKSIEHALETIEQGTYGITADGDLIPEDRLRANPAATTLVTKPKN